MNNVGTSTLIIVSGLEGNQPTHLVGAQPFLHEHSWAFIHAWGFIFCVVLVWICTRYIGKPLAGQRTHQ